MRTARRLFAVAGRLIVSAALLVSACGPSPTTDPPPALGGDGGNSPLKLPPWLPSASLRVSGHEVVNDDCRLAICQHNENTDLVRWQGAIYLVHRSAVSQILGPNSALHIYRSTDEGQHFTETARIAAPQGKLTPIDGVDQATAGRDLRDPHFFVAAGRLHLKALTRLPVTSARDSQVDTIAVVSFTSDGSSWSALQAVGPTGYSLWRVKPAAGLFYSAAYRDGDLSVTLFSSPDGLHWTKGASVYDVAADTPLETELEFLPSGRLLALVRMDGSDSELLGASGRLRTKLCWADPPYSAFDCRGELHGQRLDGPVSFRWQDRLFVIARRHLQPSYKKRTALFELVGNLDRGPLDLRLHGDLPSAGDTSYAGVVSLDGQRLLTSWYSGDLDDDVDWLPGMLGLADIWVGTLDLSRLP